MALGGYILQANAFCAIISQSSSFLILEPILHYLGFHLHHVDILPRSEILRIWYLYNYGLNELTIKFGKFGESSAIHQTKTIQISSYD